MSVLDKTKWQTELHQNSLGISFAYSKTLFDKKSPYQQVKVIETKAHGRMLLNDGVIMTCERDEFIYHEMISHVPLFLHPKPYNVLIVGGGDGGTAREVLKHPYVQACTMVEIDELVVEVSKKFLGSIGTEFDNPRLKLVIEDGAQFVKNKKEEFDVILIDSSDPIGPGQILFEEPFYQDLHKALKPDGIVISQAESPMYEAKFQKKFYQQACRLFPEVHFYNYYNLTYPGGFWSFLFCSKKWNPIKDFQQARLDSLSLKLKYYNSEIHRASFSLPEFMRLNILEPA